MKVGIVGNNKISFGNDLLAEISRPPANAVFTPSTDSPVVPEDVDNNKKSSTGAIVKGLLTLAVAALVLGVARRKIDTIKNVDLNGISNHKGFGAKLKYFIAKLGQYPVDAWTGISKLWKGNKPNPSDEIGEIKTDKAAQAAAIKAEKADLVPDKDTLTLKLKELQKKLKTMKGDKKAKKAVAKEIADLKKQIAALGDNVVDEAAKGAKTSVPKVADNNKKNPLEKSREKIDDIINRQKSRVDNPVPAAIPLKGSLKDKLKADIAAIKAEIKKNPPKTQEEKEVKQKAIEAMQERINAITERLRLRAAQYKEAAKASRNAPHVKIEVVKPPKRENAKNVEELKSDLRASFKQIGGEPITPQHSVKPCTVADLPKFSKTELQASQGNLEKKLFPTINQIKTLVAKQEKAESKNAKAVIGRQIDELKAQVKNSLQEGLKAIVAKTKAKQVVKQAKPVVAPVAKPVNKVKVVNVAKPAKTAPAATPEKKIHKSAIGQNKTVTLSPVEKERQKVVAMRIARRDAERNARLANK